MKSAIVTGAYGFLGRHTSKVLQLSGYEVFGIGHGLWMPEDSRKWGIPHWCESDITAQALESLQLQPEVIVNCAGSGLVSLSFQDPVSDYRRSVESTLAVMDYARCCTSVKSVVQLSSAAVYGEGYSDKFSIGSECKPASPYGVHKKISEDICLSFRRHFQVPVVILRLFSVYGAGLRKQLLWDACNKLTQGNYLFGGTGLEERDWLHIDDATSLILACIEAGANAPVILNGGTSKVSNVLSILQLIDEYLHGDKGGSGQCLRFTSEERVGDPSRYCADIKEALSVGWTPQVAVRTGVEEYVNWYRSLLA